MHCPRCSTELPDDARFCGGCGHRFSEEGGSAAPAEESAAPVAPAAPAAAPAGVAPPSSDAASAFEMKPEDFGRALTKACDKAGLEPPAGELPTDHASLFRVADQLGLTKLDVEKALHVVSFEKLPPSQRKAMGVVLEEDVPQTGRPLWLVAVVGVNAVALVVALVAFLLYDPAPERPPVEVKPQKGEINTEELGGSLDLFAGAAEDCYKSALEKNPELAGDVTITLRIDLEGRAAEASASADTLQDEAALACILEAAKKQSYPAARTAPVDVDVPLLFSAREK